MQRTLTFGSLIIVLLVVSSAWGAIELVNPSANATITAHPYLMVDYRNADGSDFTLARATVIEKTLNSFGNANYDLQYLASDLDNNDGYGWRGIRIVEQVTNNTDYTWTDYHIAFTAPPGTFYWQLSGSGASPGTYIVSNSGDTWTAQFAPSIATVSNPPGNQVDFYFAPGHEVAPGQSFGLYVAAVPYNLNADNTMSIVQYPTIPEPAAIIIWSLLGGLWIAISRRQRCRKES